VTKHKALVKVGTWDVIDGFTSSFDFVVVGPPNSARYFRNADEELMRFVFANGQNQKLLVAMTWTGLPVKYIVEDSG
jgi:hypothetical protein